MIHKIRKSAILVIAISLVFVVAYFGDGGENARPPLIMYGDDMYICYDSVDVLDTEDYSFTKILSQCKGYQQPNTHLESNELGIGDIIYYSENDMEYLYSFNPRTNKYVRYKLID